VLATLTKVLDIAIGTGATAIEVKVEVATEST